MSLEIMPALTEEERKKKPWWIGIWRMGGHGDHMVSIATARAFRKRFPDAGIIVFNRKIRADTDFDIYRGTTPFIDKVCKLPLFPEVTGVVAFREQVDLFVDIQTYVGVLYANKEDPQLLEMVRKNRDRILPFTFLYSMPPFSYNTLHLRWPGNQWELLSYTLGIPVREDYLFLAQREDVELPEAPYVCLHSGQGGRSRIKVPPSFLYIRTAAYLKKKGYRPVTVGSPRDDYIRGTEDRRTEDINETAAIVANSSLVICPEGFMAYVARAVNTPALILFGPTPVSLFSFSTHYSLSRGLCPPCWWHAPGWEKGCKKGLGYCANFPSFHQIEKTLGEVLCG